MKVKTRKHDQWITVTYKGEDVQFLVAPMTPKETDVLLQKHTKKEWERNQRFERMDLYGFKIDKIDLVIRDWKGLEDEEGKEYLCSGKDAKVLLFHYEPELIDLALKHVDDLGLNLQLEEEAAEKN